MSKSKPTKINESTGFEKRSNAQSTQNIKPNNPSSPPKKQSKN